MPRYHVPAFGPHAGKLCKDGVPVEDGDGPSGEVIHPVCVELDTGDGGRAARRGRDGAARAHQAEVRRYGGIDISFTEAQDRAATARAVSARRRGE